MEGDKQVVRVQYSGDSPVFVEDFKKGCERSKQGSLHLVPKKLTIITESELEHLRKNRLDVFKFIKIFPKESSVSSKEEKPPAEAEVKLGEGKVSEAEDESERNLKQNGFKKDKKKT